MLVIVSTPAAKPSKVGSNWTSSVCVCPGAKVTGSVGPDIEKPIPTRVAELTVTDAVPVDDKVNVCADGVFSATFPNAMLVALMLRVGTTAFNCRAKVLETPPAVADSVTAAAVVTEETVAVKPAVVAFAATVTVAGTFTAALLLDRLMLSPPV